MQHPWDNSTIFYQQDKEGGINPTFDPLALCFEPAQRGRQKFAAPLLIFLRLSRAHNKRETRIALFFV